MKATSPSPPRLDYDDQPIVPPPANVTVLHEHKPVLYLPDGKVLIRRAGF